MRIYNRQMYYQDSCWICLFMMITAGQLISLFLCDVNDQWQWRRRAPRIETFHPVFWDFIAGRSDMMEFVYSRKPLKSMLRCDVNWKYFWHLVECNSICQFSRSIFVLLYIHIWWLHETFRLNVYQSQGLRTFIRTRIILLL